MKMPRLRIDVALKYEDISPKGYDDDGVTHGRHRRTEPQRCGHDSTFGRCRRVDSMPTASTT